MRKIALLLIILLVMAPSENSQTRDIKPPVDQTNMDKLLLLSDLQALDAQAARLTGLLARARAKAEIADAAWTLDGEWARKVLSESYELTFPGEEERNKLREQPVGAALTFPTDVERARTEVRNRILQVAGRDRVYANQLVKLGAAQLGKQEAHLNSATLARQALNQGDKETAGKYILEAIEAEPTQTVAGLIIQDLALKDRAAADALIIKYIGQLRTYPFSFSQGTARVYFVLLPLVFPGFGTGQQPQPPGPAVMKAYASYLVESLSQLEQSAPGSLKRVRRVLLTAWQPIKQYAPELTPAFLELEQLSRGADGDGSIPTLEKMVESARHDRAKRIDESLDRGQSDAFTIEAAARRGAFAKSRKAVDKLTDGPQKTQLTELIDAQEAMSLAAKGDMAGAEKLAERLRLASPILEVYLSLINKCGKNQSCKTTLGNRALNQLKIADNKLPVAPTGVPVIAIPTSREFDPKLSSLSKLAKVAISINDDLAQDVLDEIVVAANRTSVDSEQGRLGFDADLFKMLAPKNEARARQTADGLTDFLRRIAALSAINRWKAEELTKKIEQLNGKKVKSVSTAPAGSQPASASPATKPF